MPRTDYSDDAKTFEGQANWLKKVNKDEWFHQFLIEEDIRWKFNFEAKINMTKQA